jgi:predicted nucleic acid-binding protein
MGFLPIDERDPIVRANRGLRRKKPSKRTRRRGIQRIGSAKDLLRRVPRPLYTCEAVLSEAAHFLGAPDPVLAAVADGLLVCPWDLVEHHARVRELMRKYADQPMDLADACLVAMSEKWWDSRVVTVDEADFTVYRRRGRHAIPLITPSSQ